MEQQFVFLDLKDWIALSRDYYLREQGKSYPNELEIILSYVSTGKICFPLTDTIFLEFFKHGNANRRSRLGKIVAIFSLGYVVADRRTRLAYEARQAISKLFKKSIPPNENMIVRGISRAFLSDKAFASLARLDETVITMFNRDKDNIESWIEYFKSVDEVTRRKLINSFRNANEEQIYIQEKFRQEYAKSPKLLLRAYYGRLFLDTQTIMLEVMNQYGITMDDLEELGGVVLSSEIPSYEIEAKLTIESMKQKTRRLAKNDFYDISALTGALPYCSTVVTESYWVDLCKRLMFDKKYNCQLITDYKQLSKFF